MIEFGTKIITITGDKGIVKGRNEKSGQYLIHYTDDDFKFLDSDRFIHLEYDFLDYSAFYVYEDCQNEHL